ncbi:hypothetical protein GCM10010212_26520 [Paenarthrobacter nicotinovorans]|nr:hypothetical protein GCM10010212_26520 [Paenarthrobacter nicotinovorans]
MGVDEVEGFVFEVEIVDVARLEGHVVHAALGGECGCLRHNIGRPVQAYYLSGRNQPREIARYAARSAADVED